MLPLSPHRPLLLPPLAKPCGNGILRPQPKQRTLVLLSTWASTAASSPAPRRPLPRPHRRPPPWCSRCCVVNVFNDIPSEEDYTWGGWNLGRRPAPQLFLF